MPYNEFTGEGTGFTFTSFNAHDLKEVMFLAINTYNNNRAAWKNLVKQAMKQDYSWEASASVYMDLYHKVLLK